MSLRIKITILLTLYIAVTFAALSAAIFRLERERLVSRAQASATHALADFAKSIYGRWDINEPDRRKNIVRVESTKIRNRLAANREIAYAVFQDTSGQVRYIPKNSVPCNWMVARTRFDFLTAGRLAATGSASRTFYDPAPGAGRITEFILNVDQKDGKSMGAARVGFRVDASYGPLPFLQKELFVLNLLAIVAACVLVFFVASHVEFPIKLLHMRAQNLLVSEADGEQGSTRDVLSLLVQEFDGIEKLVSRLKQNRAELVTTLSHEFRSPMQAVLGYAEFLQKGGAGRVSPEMNRYLKIIADNAERFGSFIDNVLDLARLDGGRLNLTITPFDAAQIVHSVVQLYAGKAQEQGLKLTQDIIAVNRKVRGDSNRVFQILVNLISNALKFTPVGGGICVGAIERGEGVEFYVQDNGVGIPSDQSERVFDEFYQVPGQKLIRGSKGLGIGLTLCKRLLEAQEGRIWIESQLGSGTTVRFYLPVEEAAVA